MTVINPQYRMKYVNLVSTLILVISTTFLSSFFFIGSEENFQKLLENLFKSFLFRFIGFTGFGLFFLSILIVVNFILNKFFNYKINLKKLSLTGIIWVSLASLIGTSIFFF
ncbi:MAG: hypothetical protein ACI9FW_001466 [Flavobacterium sp.]|jgi:hypothetical protein